MKIMCLNSWGGKLHEALLPYLVETAPDILCLQEVTHSPASDKDWLTYRDGDHVLPQRANLFRDVSGALPDHVAVFCPAAQGRLWDGDRAIPSQWGLASFVHRSLPIIGQVQGFVHRHLDVVLEGFSRLRDPEACLRGDPSAPLGDFACSARDYFASEIFPELRRRVAAHLQRLELARLDKQHHKHVRTMDRFSYVHDFIKQN